MDEVPWTGGNFKALLLAILTDRECSDITSSLESYQGMTEMYS